jgi:hypothetical protein
MNKFISAITGTALMSSAIVVATPAQAHDTQYYTGRIMCTAFSPQGAWGWGASFDGLEACKRAMKECNARAKKKNCRIESIHSEIKEDY